MNDQVGCTISWTDTRSEPASPAFEGWALVEIFGHQRYAGYVTTQAFGQAVLFRVEVPPLAARARITKHYEFVNHEHVPPGSTVQEEAIEGYTKLFGIGAIYSITPCTQEAAERALDAMKPRKLTLVKLGTERALPSADPLEEDVSHDAEPDSDEDEREEV